MEAAAAATATQSSEMGLANQSESHSQSEPEPEKHSDPEAEPLTKRTRQVSKLGPRSDKHPTLQSRRYKLLMNAFMILFILLACCLFLWGRSLFVEMSEQVQVTIPWKGAQR